MKTFVTVVFVSLAIMKLVECLSDEIREQLIKIHNECSEITGINEETALLAAAGEFTDDPKLKEHAFCFSKKLGFQNEAGEIQVGVLKEKLLMALDDPSKVDEIISKCAVQQATPEDTAFETSKCVYKMKQHS